MNLRATMSLAVSALLRNRMRSMLTMLGVIIGVAAVLMMEALGQGATAYIGDTISGLGSNMLMVVPGSPTERMGGSSAGAPLFTLNDVEALRRNARDVALLAAVSARPLRTVVGGRNRNTPVNGAQPEYLQIRACLQHCVSSDLGTGRRASVTLARAFFALPTGPSRTSWRTSEDSRWHGRCYVRSS